MTDPHHRPQETSAGGWSRLDTVAAGRHRARGRDPPIREPRTAYRTRLRRDLLRARCVLVRHRHPGRLRDHRPRQPRPPAAREVADRVGHRPLRLRPVRLAGGIGGDRNGDRRPRLPAWPAPAAVDHDPDRRHRRSGRRGRTAGDRLPPPRPLAHRDARLVHHVLRRRGGARRRPRSRPSTRADRCAVVVAPHPRPPVAPGGGHLPRRGRGREVVGGLRRAGGHRPRGDLGDRRAETGRAGRRMGCVGRRRVPARGAADVRPAGDRATARVRRQLHRPDAGRARGAAVGRGIGVARDLGAPARDARLPHGSVGRPPLPVAGVVVAADQAPGCVLVRRRGWRLPRDPGDGQPSCLVAGTGGTHRPRRHLVAGRLERAGGRSSRSSPERRAPTCRGWCCRATAARRSSGTCCRRSRSCAWRSASSRRSPGSGWRRGSPRASTRC